MSDVFYLRPMDPPATPEAVLDMASQAGGCFDLHRVDWSASYLAADGGRMLCWYRAPDAESARNALKQLGSDMNDVWSGSVHDAANAAPTPNVLVERTWDEPVAFEDIQALEDAGAHCLETHNVQFVRSFFASDRKRMVCLYHAPDAESVRIAQRQASMPVDKVWAIQLLKPAG